MRPFKYTPYRDEDHVKYEVNTSSDIPEINIMSWNIANLGGGFGYPKKRSDETIQKTAELIADEDPDILITHEVLKSGREKSKTPPPDPFHQSRYDTRYQLKRKRSPDTPVPELRDTRPRKRRRKKETTESREPGVSELHRIATTLNQKQTGHEAYPAPGKATYTRGETYGVFFKPDKVELLESEIHLADTHSKAKFHGRAPMIFPFSMKGTGEEFEVMAYHAPSNSSKNSRLRKHDFKLLEKVIREKKDRRPMLLAADLNSEDLKFRDRLVDTKHGHRRPLTSNRATSLRRSKLADSNMEIVDEIVGKFAPDHREALTPMIAGFLSDTRFDHRSRCFDTILPVHDPDKSLIPMSDTVVGMVEERDTKEEQLEALKEARKVSDHVPVKAQYGIHSWRDQSGVRERATPRIDSADESESEMEIDRPRPG